MICRNSPRRKWSSRILTVSWSTCSKPGGPSNMMRNRKVSTLPGVHGSQITRKWGHSSLLRRWLSISASVVAAAFDCAEEVSACTVAERAKKAIHAVMPTLATPASASTGGQVSNATYRRQVEGCWRAGTDHLGSVAWRQGATRTGMAEGATPERSSLYYIRRSWG